jgi:hypothetical protein
MSMPVTAPAPRRMRQAAASAVLALFAITTGTSCNPGGGSTTTPTQSATPTPFATRRDPPDGARAFAFNSTFSLLGRITVVLGPAYDSITIHEISAPEPRCPNYSDIRGILAAPSVGPLHAYERLRTAFATYTVGFESVTSVGGDLDAYMDVPTSGQSCELVYAMSLDQALLKP